MRHHRHPWPVVKVGQEAKRRRKVNRMSKIGIGMGLMLARYSPVERWRKSLWGRLGASVVVVLAEGRSPAASAVAAAAAAVSAASAALASVEPKIRRWVRLV